MLRFESLCTYTTWKMVASKTNGAISSSKPPANRLKSLGILPTSLAAGYALFLLRIRPLIIRRLSICAFCTAPALVNFLLRFAYNTSCISSSTLNRYCLLHDTSDSNTLEQFGHPTLSILHAIVETNINSRLVWISFESLVQFITSSFAQVYPSRI